MPNQDSELAHFSKRLTLPLATGDAPFALQDAEVAMGPDDWAWSFLRLNREYQQAFEKQRDGLDLFGQPKGTKDKTSIENDLFLAHSTHFCQIKFGLASWRDPKEPTLGGTASGESWFFPLKRPIAEDYKRQVVDNLPYLKSSGPLFVAKDKRTIRFLETEETQFGYRKPRGAEVDRAGETDMSMTCMAIDCSVPPDGQLNSLRTLVEHNREYLVGWDYQTNNRLSKVKLFAVDDSDVFTHMKFRRALAGIPSTTDVSALWFAVYVDVLGPIDGQLNGYLKLLRAKHTSLVAEKLAQPSPLGRFQRELPKAKEMDGSYICGGNYLKALLIIHELTEMKLSTNQIAEFSGTGRSSRGYLHAWHEHFHNNIEEYQATAQGLVNSGYRWLIHSQIPREE